MAGPLYPSTKNLYQEMHDGTVRVYLSQDKFAIIDRDAVGLLTPYRWFAYRSRIGSTFYARSNSRWNDGRVRMLHMHRIVCSAPEGVVVDHIDGNGLNNTSENLRLSSAAANAHNSGIRNTNKSGYKGVSWKASNKKWVAQICVNYKKRHIGLFDNVMDAARAYDATARAAFGSSATLNFPENGERQADRLEDNVASFPAVLKSPASSGANPVPDPGP